MSNSCLVTRTVLCKCNYRALGIEISMKIMNVLYVCRYLIGHTKNVDKCIIICNDVER